MPKKTRAKTYMKTRVSLKYFVNDCRLKNVYLKNQNITIWNNYKYQQIFCTNLLRKTKFDYFRDLNVKDLNDNKTF